MSIVNSIETVRDWLTAEVCPLVKLKLPDDNATDASYPYKLVNPAAFSLFVPSKDRTPPNIAAPIPSVCVQIVQGDDDLLQSARDIKIRLCFSAWDPGYHGPDIFKPKGDGSGTYIQQYNEAAASYFVKNGEGWRDAWNFVDTALRLIEMPSTSATSASSRRRASPSAPSRSKTPSPTSTRTGLHGLSSPSRRH